jgi:hypothetical protein
VLGMPRAIMRDAFLDSPMQCSLDAAFLHTTNPSEVYTTAPHACSTIEAGSHERISRCMQQGGLLSRRAFPALYWTITEMTIEP